MSVFGPDHGAPGRRAAAAPAPSGCPISPDVLAVVERHDDDVRRRARGRALADRRHELLDERARDHAHRLRVRLHDARRTPSVDRKSTLLSRSAMIVAERGLSVSSAISPVSSPRPTSPSTTWVPSSLRQASPAADRCRRGTARRPCRPVESGPLRGAATRSSSSSQQQRARLRVEATEDRAAVQQPVRRSRRRRRSDLHQSLLDLAGRAQLAREARRAAARRGRRTPAASCGTSGCR